IIVGIVLWIIEIFTPGSFVMGIFGTSCLIVAPFAGVGMSVKMQLLIFGVATVIMAFGIRPLIMRHFYRREDKTKTNVEALVGKSGLVTEDIDYMAGTGRVKIGGEVWSAITPDESRVAIGQKVTVREIEGCKVIVEVTNEKEGRKS
ncbi:MAG TPA: NfeD family protein, partial [Syntrophales bacterium]|nr:NfeD family protein [Syntrophales bacterium]